MNLNISFEESDGYLLVRASGEWTTNAVQQMIDDIAREVVVLRPVDQGNAAGIASFRVVLFVEDAAIVPEIA